MKTKILFVDDEAMVLSGLRRVLQSLRKDADMHFMGSGQEALDFLAVEPCDVIVSDMRMPGMNGVEFLERVKQHYPQTIRFILSGQSDDELVSRSIKSAHQFLAKPCNPGDFKEKLALILTRGALCNTRANNILSEIGTLPSAPALYHKIEQILENPSADNHEIAETISQDVSMTASVLRLVNSSFFGLSQALTSAVEATNYLGLDTIRSLVLGIGAFTSFENINVDERDMQTIWDHSLKVAMAAKSIALAAIFHFERHLDDTG